MITIGLIRESKIPADNRVALTPAHCKWIHKNSSDVKVIVQPSPHRCFSDKEYQAGGATVQENLDECDILLGIKEVNVAHLIAGKTYLFFSHTRKKQPHNRDMLKAILAKKITLIDYECLEHEDGQRILGFGFFAGIVGAHNGMMAYGNRTGLYKLERVHTHKSFRELFHVYFGLKLPPVKVVITGSGRVAHGVLEIMNLMGIIEVEPEEFLERRFSYPVFTQLKGAGLYAHKVTGSYNRSDFHHAPANYLSKFLPYSRQADILMNGVYWDKSVPPLFSIDDLQGNNFNIQTIADITDDKQGSIPCNLGDTSIDDPVYGVDRTTMLETKPYLPGSVDIMAVGNLPNELPRDASRYFGQQLIKYVLEDLTRDGSAVIDRATMTKQGELTHPFKYLKDYVV